MMLRKWIVFGLMAVCINSGIYAQIEWFEEGEVFSYEVTTGFDFQNYGIHTFTVTGDTMIDQLSMKQLLYTDLRGPVTYFYAYQKGDSLYQYIEGIGMELNYDFSLESGDATPDGHYFVAEVDTMFIFGKDRRTQLLDDDFQQVLVVEGIGPVGLPSSLNEGVCSPLFIRWGCQGALDGYDYFFRCVVSEGGEEHYDPYFICSASDGITNVRSNAKIYPNPARDEIRLDIDAKNFRVVILDAKGLLVQEAHSEKIIQLKKTVPSGTYYIKILQGRELLHSQPLFIKR